MTWADLTGERSISGRPVPQAQKGRARRRARGDAGQLGAAFRHTGGGLRRSGSGGLGWIQPGPGPARTGNVRDSTVYSGFALGSPNAKYMIRRGDFKYSSYANDSGELYALRADPQEMRRLASLPEHRGRVEEMKAQLSAWCRG